MTRPIIVDLFAGECVHGWGVACRDCQDEPHDCEECLGILTPRACIDRGRDLPLLGVGL